MKTQKQFFISGMFKTLKFLGICLMLAALFASGAKADTIYIDPGTPGEGAKNFDFGAIDLSESGLIKVVFADNKTIKWDAGSHFFQSPGNPGLKYFGAFLDLNLDPIDTALFAGRTLSGGGSDLNLPIAFASLEQDGVFRGMLFDFSGGSDVANFDWVWDPNDRPLVGMDTEVIFEGNNATGIRNLAVNGKVYDVEFRFDSAENIYGEDLIFDFQEDGIDAARRAVNDALNSEPAVETVGPIEDDDYSIGFGRKGTSLYVEVTLDYYRWPRGPWTQTIQTSLTTTDSVWTYADFTEVTAPPSDNVVQVFVTSLPHNGNFGELADGDGLAGADQFCQNLAVAADLSGTWTAWLSDDTTDARDRIPDGEYQLLDETVIANDLDDLTDGELEAPINLDETGGGGATPGVWTSTQPDGTTIDPVSPGNTTSNCQNWTSSEQETGGCTNGDLNCAATGNTNEMDGDWTLNGGTASPFVAQCSAPSSLYCFSGGE